MADNTTTASSSSAQNEFLRVEAVKISDLMDLVGELGLCASEVMHHPELNNVELEQFHLAAHRLNNLIQETQDIASSLSLVPLKSVFSRMRRLVRELAQQTQKELVLQIVGEDVEVDKRVVDSLYDPLVHIVRNSADHGLEGPEERIANGKDKAGTITIKAIQNGSEIHIIIADDGRGLNRDKILEKARDRGIVGPNETPSDNQIWGYIFHPGFSTADQISNLSGRGVGMDVVASTIQNLRGHISVESATNKGTTITIKIPMTLAFLECFVVSVDKRYFAIPVDDVLEVLKPLAENVVTSSADASESVKVRGRIHPVIRLQDFYNEVRERRAIADGVILILRSSTGAFCVPVDEIIAQQQVTMKPLVGNLKDIRAGSGCALLHTGEVAIALDCEAIKNLYEHERQQ